MEWRKQNRRLMEWMKGPTERAKELRAVGQEESKKREGGEMEENDRRGKREENAKRRRETAEFDSKTSRGRERRVSCSVLFRGDGFYSLKGIPQAHFPVAAYGDHWHEMRKIVVEEMLSNRVLRSFADMRASEINAKVSEASRLCLANDQQLVKVDMRKLLEELTFNMVA
ncbi:hypothetical protein EJ110_NYTH21639 [Nymphaea thermarum]|nr:hypothetical protein EJ110_NYTH21639 [Nymphaea thermarum]